jgi:hypothetical protein
MGAIASGGVVVVNDDAVAAGSASRPEAIQRVADEGAARSPAASMPIGKPGRRRT